tara:strand:+ start:307 stop:1383 length:1077 start_codon:yes stop_codon:yes gene_type:complete
MNTEINAHKPAPFVTGKRLEIFNLSTEIKKTIQALEAGKPVLIADFYSNGILLLKELQQYLKSKMPHKTFQEQREYRAAYHKLSNLILLEIINYKIDVKKAPAIGWLEKLYTGNTNFLLTFPQVQGLNSSWQWYQNGISVPTLRNKIHPYYGVYFPTRFDHLTVFDNWLKRYEGPKKSAIDIGVGSGALSFQLVGHGFQKVYGTDINPNAIIGLTEFMGDTKLSRKIELDHASLFGKWDKQTELIVFNPPWLPISSENDRTDKAMYYPEELFPDFFAAAKERLAVDGKLVILFSNLAQITDVTNDHPIENEISHHDRFQLERCYKKRVKAASDKTTRDQNWRGSEEVELWVLVHKNSD